MLAGSFSARAYSFFDTLFWIACLNMLWIIFTVLGAGILGIGPATAAAHIMVRRRVRGGSVPLLRDFVRAYIANFVRANIVIVPLLVVALALVMNWSYVAETNQPAPELLRAIMLLCATGLTGTLCYVFPMFARYELPAGRYVLTSSRFAARNLPGTVLLLFTTAACVYASVLLPGLILFFSFGVWIYVTGWLCDRFFAANDEASETVGSTTQVSEPR